MWNWQDSLGAWGQCLGAVPWQGAGVGWGWAVAVAGPGLWGLAWLGRAEVRGLGGGAADFQFNHTHILSSGLIRMKAVVS